MQSDEGTGQAWDVTGFYVDEAVVAPRIIGTASTPCWFPPAQVQYHKTVLTQFHTLRHYLFNAETGGNGRESQSTTNPGIDQSRPSFPIGNANPSTSDVRRMDEAEKMEALRCLSRELDCVTRQDRAKIYRLGAWCWAVLGSLDGSETLGSDELAEVRGLAKAAVTTLQRETRGGTSADITQTNKMEDALDDFASPASAENMLVSHLERSNDIGRGRIRDDGERGPDTVALHNLAEESKIETGDDRSCTTLLMVCEMILTVVGEVYGQRDLLDSRLTWPTAINGTS